MGNFLAEIAIGGLRTMKKRQPQSKIQDHVASAEYRYQRNNPVRGLAAFYADPSPPRPHRKINYVSGPLPREEPADIPRLFIRGLGGSIKTDLRGIGIQLSAAAFAHWVSDESLADFHIHRGDIAIIDPGRQILREGSFVLVELNGQGVLRRLTTKRRVWHLETAGGASAAPLPLVEIPLQGVVVGITRFFTRIQPVCYRGTETNFVGSVERSGSDGVVGNSPRRTVPTPKGPNKQYSNRKKTPFLLAGEERSPYALTETGKPSFYSSRAKRR